MHRSFWESDSLFKPYDLLVIGAGITGLSSALFFKQRYPGSRVCVLEKGFIPQGASTRNAGFACIGSVTELMDDLDKVPEKELKQRLADRINGLTLLKKVLGKEAIQYNQCGGYEIFTSQNTYRNALRNLSRVNNWLHDIGQEETVYHKRQVEGYPAIYNRLEGALHPGKMMQTLIKTAADYGVEIKWNTTAEKTNAHGSVTLKNGQQLSAEKILIAANGFTPHLLPATDIEPARGLVLVTNELNHLPWKGIFHYDRGYIYFRNVGNRLLIGGARNIAAGRESTSEFGINDTIKGRLVTVANDLLKLPGDWDIEKQWSGIMGFTATKTPQIKQIDDHRYIAAGLSGMGLAIGLNTAKRTTNMLGY